MEFRNKILDTCQKISSRMNRVLGNEQATKESLIKPFFNALGYDTEDPDTWFPEYNADFPGKKRSEKVDYVIFQNGSPTVLVEAKAYTPSESSLGSKDGQLARYFSATPTARISIISNGIIYRFFTDLDRENIQDETPFFVFDCNNPIDSDLAILEMFTPQNYNVIKTKEWASDNRGNEKVRVLLKKLLTNPSENNEFVKLVLGQTSIGTVKTKNAVETLSLKLPSIMKDALNDVISERLGLHNKKQENQPQETQQDTLVTTVEELNTYYAIRGLISGAGKDVSKLIYKDYANWFNISVSRPGNWFLRLYFNGNDKYMILRLPLEKTVKILERSDGLSTKPSGTQISVSSDTDIISYAKAILEAFEQIQTSKEELDETE